MTRGLVIGKFYPPHLGHSYLINYALEHSDEVIVLICDSPLYTIPATTRQDWLQRIHPRADVRIIPDIGKDDDSEAWAQHTIEFLGEAPDVVFSSEDYGITYAACMGCEHVMVDRKRTHVPISATRIRNNILKEWDFLDPIVKADLALRIDVVGAESTGTTTLAKSLAKAAHAPWVPEYGRLYSEAFLHTDHEWKDEEFVHIAKTQQALERAVAATSHGVIICDTNAFATSIWQERYMGHTTNDVAAIANTDKADLYIVTGDEIPFVQDGTRDGEHIRHSMHQRFVEELTKKDIPLTIIRGSRSERLKKAKQAMQNILAHADITKVYERQAAH